MKTIFNKLNKNMEKHSSKILNATEISQHISNILKLNLQQTIQTHKIDRSPKLKVFLIGNNPNSKIYIENKFKVCQYIGIDTELICFNKDVKESEILENIKESNKDKETDAIMVQLPLPDYIDKLKVLSMVDPKKDVDGLNPFNLGILTQVGINNTNFVPPTALGVHELIRLALIYQNKVEDYNAFFAKNFNNLPCLNLKGLNVTVMGRGQTSGLPISALLQYCHGSVCVCHSFTKDPIDKCKSGDILITAIGCPQFITKEYIKDDAIVIDVGINVVERTNGRKLFGDVDFNEAIEKASFISPVPGGVGKMTVVMLARNIIKAWSNHLNVNLENNLN